MEEAQAYLNGRWMLASQAMISPVDAGFVLGASIAEQVRTFRGVPFRLEDHVRRLEQSLQVVGIESGLSQAEWIALGLDAVARNRRLQDSEDDLGLSMFATPGLYAAYAEPGPIRPTLCVHTYPLPFRLWAGKYRQGQALVTSSVRQVPPECWSPEVKCRSRVHYFLADKQAAAMDPGARAVLLDMAGLVTEASTANVLIYRADEGLLAVPRGKVLHGISMDVLTELAAEIGIRTGQRDLTPQDLATADEVLLSSTPFCLLPVTRLDRKPIGGGQPGPIFRRLLVAWSERVGVDIAGQAERFAQRKP